MDRSEVEIMHHLVNSELDESGSLLKFGLTVFFKDERGEKQLLLL